MKRLALLITLACALLGCATFNVGAPSGPFLGGGGSSTESPPQPAPHKLGALVPQRAGDFFVSPSASSPFKIADASSVTRDTIETTHGRITAGGGGTDAQTIIGPYTANATIAALYLLPNGTAAGTNNYAIQNDAPGNVYFNTANNPGAFYWYNGNFSLLATLNQSYLALNANVAGGLQIQSTVATNSILGSLAYTTRTVTASFTVDTTTTDNHICANTSAGILTVTLPAPTNGRRIELINCGFSGGSTGWALHNLTLAPHGTEKINGVASSKTLSGAGQPVCEVESVDGVNWFTNCQWLLPLGLVLGRKRRRTIANDNAERVRDWLARAA